MSVVKFWKLLGLATCDAKGNSEEVEKNESALTMTHEAWFLQQFWDSKGAPFN